MDEREKAAGHRRNSAPSLVDPNIPRLICQSCRHAICVVGIESDKFSNDPSWSGLQASSIQSSIMGSIQMDNSFVVLPKKRAQVPSVPAHHHIGNPLSDTTNAKKTIEDSFIVLPPAAASIYKSKSVAEGVEAHLATGGNTNSSAFHSTVDVLQRAFEIASNQTQVEQPLCLECLPILSNKFDQEIEDINKDIKAYECYLKNSKDKSYDMLSDEDFLKEKLKLEKEERKLNAAIEETEKQFAEVNAELEDLDSKSMQFKELKERYWHDFNDFQFQLTTHQEERDSILAKIEVSQAHLELLKKTNVLNDAFTIWHSGDFGTINNFRLGRLPNIPVEWDEINAAWGQACLLLHTMAQYFYPKFPYQIKINPMGSYPRILDHNKNSFELFGPVNLFWSTRYDKAMTLFLTCLNDFAEFANSMDRENNIPAEKCFKFPYKIENDRVEDYTITQSFNKPENWTKSLKYTLCNLKWALYWFIGNTDFQPVSNMVHSHN